MHLEDEPGASPLLAQPVVDPHHRHLDDVGVRALHDEVDGEPLAERARLPVRGAQLRHRAPPAEQARRVAVARGVLDRPRDEVLDVREAGEVRVDVRLRLLARDLEVLGEPERRDPVDDPEVDHLRDRALAGRQLGRVHAEHLRGGRRVDVLAAREGLAQLRLAGDVREDPQLDLRVVGREQLVPRLGDEGRADLATELGADRDRLEVRVRRREPARRGDRLVDRRVQAAVLCDQARQRAQVGVHELRVLAPLLDHGDDLVLAADRAEDSRVGREAGLALAARRELELLEQDAADLLGRAEHELLARELVGPGFELLDPLAQARRDLAHPVLVDLDARDLHRGEHGRERELDLAVERLHAALAHAREERPGEPRGRGGAADERLGLLLGGRIGAELEAVLRRQLVEGVRRARRLDQVREQQRVLLRGDALRLGVVDDEGPVRFGRTAETRRRGRRRASATRSSSLADASEPDFATDCCLVPRARAPRSARGPSAPPARRRRARRRGPAGCGTRSAGTSPSAASGRAGRGRAASRRSRARGRAASSPAPSTAAPGRRAR